MPVPAWYPNRSPFHALCGNVRSEQIYAILRHRYALPSADPRYQHPNHTQINMYYSALPLVVAGFLAKIPSCTVLKGKQLHRHGCTVVLNWFDYAPMALPV